MSRRFTVKQGNVELAVEEVPAKQELRPPLLLIHGTTTDSSLWDDTRGELSEDRRLYLLNRRGRGGSTDEASYAIEDEGRDVAATLATLATRHPEHARQGLDVVAHSYGALCVLKALSEARHLIGRLALYEPPLLPASLMPPPSFAEELRAALAAGRNEAVVESFFRAIERLNDRQLGKLRSMSSWAMRVASAPTIPRELEAVGSFTLPALAPSDLTFPVLILVGGLSPSFIVEASDRVGACFSSTRREAMPGQRHGAMNSAPALFVDTLRAFFV